MHVCERERMRGCVRVCVREREREREREGLNESSPLYPAKMDQLNLGIFPKKIFPLLKMQERKICAWQKKSQDDSLNSTTGQNSSAEK